MKNDSKAASILGWLFLLIVFSFFQCSSPQKLIDQKQYEEAFSVLLQKSGDGRLNATQTMQLKQVYHIANQNDHEAVKVLKASGQPDIWPEVYIHLQNIQQRANAAGSLTAAIRHEIDYKPLDLKEDIQVAKIKASQYYSGMAEKLLETGDKSDSKQALLYLEQLQKLNPAYPALDKKLRKAVFNMADKILLGFKNKTGVKLPAGLADKILDPVHFTGSAIQNKIIFSPELASGNTYQLLIVLNEIDVSPHKSGQTNFTEQYENAKAEVVRNELQKSASLKGHLQIAPMNSKKAVLVSPFDVTSGFEYTYVRYTGDERALSQENLKLSRKAAIPFPSDESLIRDAADELNKTVALLLK